MTGGAIGVGLCALCACLGRSEPVGGSAPTRPAPRTFYQTGFEGCGEWTPSGAESWECGAQTDDAFGPPSGRSGDTVIGTRLNANYDYYSQHALLDSPPLTLPADASRPTVRFWMDLENETNTTCGGGMCDGAHLLAKVNDGDFIPVDFGDGGMRGLPRPFRWIVFAELPSWGPTQPLGEWGEVIVELWRMTTPGLDAIGPGDTVTLRFDHWSDTGDVMPGWYLDDFWFGEQASPPIRRLPYAIGFDAWDGWYPSSHLLWEVGAQTDDAAGPPSGRSGSSVLGTVPNRLLSAAGFNVGRTDSYVSSPVIELGAALRPTLRFFMDMEAQRDHDGGNLWLAVDGGPFVPLAFNDPALSGIAHTNDGDLDTQNGHDGTGWSGTLPAGEWGEVVVDLYALTAPVIEPGSRIELRFSFHVNHSDNDHAGWLIDDLSLTDP